MHTHTIQMNLTTQRRLNQQQAKEMLTTFATHCRLKIQLFSNTYAHFTHSEMICASFLSYGVCVRPRRVHAHIHKTPPHWMDTKCQFLACIFRFACMHPNNDRPISTRILADRHKRKRKKRLIKYKRIKVIHSVINIYIYTMGCWLYGANGMHNFVVVFCCHLSPTSSSSLSSTSLLL